MDKYLFIYLVFLFFVALSSIITGYTGTFINRFLGTYLSIIATYSATYVLIKKYNGTGVLVWLFVGLGVFDAVVTIGQFYQLDYVNRLLSNFGLYSDLDFLQKVSDRDSLMGHSISGLLGPVLNGYFLSAVALLVLCNKRGNTIINLLLWGIVMIASFLAQERAGFYLAILFSLFIFARELYGRSRSLFVLFSFLLLICLVLYFSKIDLLFAGDSRYARGFDLQDRGELRSSAWNFFLRNPMGGFYAYEAQGYGSPHIFPLNALLYGGLFGGVTIVALLIIQLVKIFPYLFRKSNSEAASWAFIFGLMYVDFSCNSMVHNASMIQGTFLFFIWWGAFLAFAKMNEEQVLME